MGLQLGTKAQLLLQTSCHCYRPASAIPSRCGIFNSAYRPKGVKKELIKHSRAFCSGHTDCILPVSKGASILSYTWRIKSHKNLNDINLTLESWSDLFWQFFHLKLLSKPTSFWEMFWFWHKHVFQRKTLHAQDVCTTTTVHETRLSAQHAL